MLISGSKPEKWFYMEGCSDSVKSFLKCRTVGVCITHNRLLGFHIVRSTRPCNLIMSSFVTPREYCCPRPESHKARWPTYPQPDLYLTATQKYFFRSCML